MKFPKSLHAEGWANHIDTTPTAGRPSAPKSVAAAPLHPAKQPAVDARLNAAASPSPSATPPVPPQARVEPPLRPSAAAPRAGTAHALPPRRDEARNWMIPAGVGAAVIAALAVWAMNRPAETPSTPPALVTGSAEPQTEVAAATPAPEAPAASQAEAGSETTTTAAAEPAPADPAPARVGLPVTTVKPAPDRVVAQAPIPPARPDLVVRANPRSPVEEARPTPYLQPTPSSTATAAAPAPVIASTEPFTVAPGTAPIVMPPTAAGPTSATPQTAPPAVSATPQAVPPVATTTPETAASATSPGLPPLAQAAAQPSPEDSGITIKVRSALAADAGLSALPITVSTDHGVVKLEGQAPDAPTRERATVVVAGTLGVKAVDNRLTLPPSPVVSQAPSGF